MKYGRDQQPKYENRTKDNDGDDEE